MTMVDLGGMPVVSQVRRLHCRTVIAVADPEQPVSAAMDFGIEADPISGEPVVAITIWGENCGIAAMIPARLGASTLTQLAKTFRELSANADGAAL